MSTTPSTALTRDAHIQYPVICGAMYPCSNWELIAAVSEAGGIGIIQPISLIYVGKQDFRDAIRKIKAATQKPIGMNVLTEKSSQAYLERMSKWLDIALEEGVRFFVTSLGDPKWIVDRVQPYGGIVYHDVTEKKWAEKAVKAGVHGLIAVNNRAGGHAGAKAPQVLLDELKGFGLPVVAAGGVGDEASFTEMIAMGYAGVQMGTRFIATTECSAHEAYKSAIVNAKPDDIVLTDKISGVPVSVIRTPYLDKTGAKAGPIAAFLLRHPKTKHYMRLFYQVQSVYKMKQAYTGKNPYDNFLQAGKSVAGVQRVEPAGDIVRRYGEAWAARG